MNSKEYHHYAHGKLLLTGEYFVLDGAEALAVPTQLGQKFTAYSIEHKQSQVHWKSLDRANNYWFEGKFYLDGLFYPSYLSDEATGKRILEFLNAALDMAPGSLQGRACEVVTALEFHRDWGLGSSSTLVHAFADWLGIDAYELLNRTFGGSGYDIACAGSPGPLVYSNSTSPPISESTDLNWDFKQQLLFIYLGSKQDSREGIQLYKKQPASPAVLDQASRLTRLLIHSSDIGQFRQVLDKHEELVSEFIGLKKVKELNFPDYPGSIKSLGAWGGDFILAASEIALDESIAYFQSKGLGTQFCWQDLVLEK